eukprot:COSAG02_NODE_53156_length_303_cov_1.205882_1_plen_37_part_10
MLGKKIGGVITTYSKVCIYDALCARACLRVCLCVCVC